MERMDSMDRMRTGESMARKVRMDVTVSPDVAEWVIKQCEDFDRKPPYIIERALRFAMARGMDLSSGQARETAAALGNRP
jgi:hypothetical protein